MSRNSLSRTPSNSFPLRNTRALDLLAILEPPPEPTTTLSGVVPGAALYDTPPPNLDPQEFSEGELAQRPRRTKTPTEKGNLWSTSVKQSQDRSAKIHRTKARRSSGLDTSSLNGNTTDGGYSTTATEDQPIEQMQEVQVTNSHSRAASARRATHSSECAPGAGETARNPGSGPPPATRRPGARSASPTPVPGTPGADPESPTPNSFDATARATTESEYTYLIESFDPRVLDIENLDKAILAIAVERVVEYDCSEVDVATLKAMYFAIAQDRAAPVEPPKQQAQVVMLSPSPINVGGGHHRDRLQITGPNPSQSAKRSSTRLTAKRSKRQKVTINTNNTDTVSESPPSSTSSESEPATEPETPADHNPDIPHPSRSPSPIDPHAPGWLDLPYVNPPRSQQTLGTTQSSTQPSRRASQSTQRTTEITLAQPPRSRSSAQVVPPAATNSPFLSQPPHTGTQSRQSTQPTQPNLYVPSKPPTPNRHNPNQPSSSKTLPRLQRAPPPGTDLASLRRSSRHKVQARRSKSQHQTDSHPQTAAPSYPRAPHAEALREGQSLLLRDLSREVRVARETHRRQKLADAIGLAPEDIAPSLSERENLEEDLVGDNEEQRVAAVAEASGTQPAARHSKPSARDLHGYERQVVTPAKMLLLAHTLKEGPFQTRGTFTEWAGDVWLDAWRQQLPHVTPRAAAEAIKQIMVNSLATGRGRFKEPVRPLVQYKLGFIKPAITADDINHNLKLFRKLHPNTFHCTEYSPPYGHYESDIVTHAIAATLFGSPTAIGVEHQQMFNPMPLTTSAYMLSIIQFCIEEYETGQFRARDLSMADMLNKYVAHLRGLKEARAAAKRRISGLQQHWFNFGFEYSGAIPPDEPYNQPITLRADVRPDTPEPDSDDSGQTELEGGQPELEAESGEVQMNKGKGRAH